MHQIRRQRPDSTRGICRNVCSKRHFRRSPVDIITDVLLRMNLPMTALRGQTYDGTSSMAGQYNGCQALVRQKYPLAVYVHCGAHCDCVNLVMEAVAACSPHLRDPVQWVHELGTLSHQSHKFKNMFAGNAGDAYSTYRNLRPLCPTRWSVRVDSIRRVLSQYAAVLDTLHEYGRTNASTESKSRVSGLYERFSKGNTLMCLKMAVSVFEVLENLCTALQGRQVSVSGMMEAVSQTKTRLAVLRNDDNFTVLFQSAERTVSELDIEPIQLPRQTRPPRRRETCTSSDAHIFHSASEFYKPIYFTVIDTALQSLHSRFNQQSFSVVKELEECVLSGDMAEIVKQYPEVDATRLAVQLPMFRSSFDYSNVSQAVTALQSVSPETR